MLPGAGSVAGEGLVEGVEQDNGDYPEDDLGGNTFLFGYFFVQIFILHSISDLL
jgi:hypothetical protein